jgi:hypothetical protein
MIAVQNSRQVISASFRVHAISHFLLGTSSPTQNCTATNREQLHSCSYVSLYSQCSNSPIPEARQNMSVNVLRLMLILPLRQGKDFFADHSHCRAAPPANPSLLNWRSLFGSFRFSGRPTDAPQPPPRVSRHWNFSLRSKGKSSRTVEVAPARDEDVSGSSPFQFHSIKLHCRDMVSPPKLMRKRLQPCNAQMAMRPIIQCNQASPQQGHKYPMYNQSKRKRKSRQAERKVLLTKE